MAGFSFEPTAKRTVAIEKTEAVVGSCGLARAEAAKASHPEFEIAFGNFRGSARASGTGLLSLALLIVATTDQLQAGPSDTSFLDDGNIRFKDLTGEYGVIELTTADGRTILLDDPGETIILRRVGSSISESYVTNSVATMLSYAKDQQDAMHTYALGLSGPAANGSNGSSTLFLEAPSLTPINFVSPPENFVPLNLLATPSGTGAQQVTFVPPTKAPPIPPVLSVPPSVITNETSVNEGGSFAISGVSIRNAVSVDLTVLNGTLHIDDNGLPTGVTVTGDDSNHLAVSGDATTVNALLAGLTYALTGPADEGTDLLTVSVTGTDGSRATATSAITVNPVAEPPVASIAGPVITAENATNVAITGVIVGPLAEDSNDTVSATLTIAHGTLHINNGGLPPGLTVVGNDSGDLVISGDAAAVNTLLCGLTYTPTQEFEGTDTIGLSVTSTDGINTFPTSATTSTTITINGVAETPIVSTPYALSTTVDHAAVALTGLSVQPADNSTSDAQDTFNVTLSVSHGLLSVANHTGLSGWFAGSAVTFSGSLAAVQAALVDNNITYAPDFGFEGTDTLFVTATTTEEASVGGGTSAPASGSATINVNEIPDLSGHVIGLDDGNAVEQQPVTVASPLNDGGHPVFLPNSLVTYSWQVSTNGLTWTEEGNQETFMPGAADLGDKLRVVITYDERAPQNPENEGLDTVTLSAGTVQADPPADLGAHAANSNTFALIGTNQANALTGGSPSNIIAGGGSDNMPAGFGHDNIFVFKAMADSPPVADQFDAMIGFAHNTDHVELSFALATTSVQGQVAETNTVAANILDSAHNEIALQNPSGASNHMEMDVFLTGSNINLADSDVLHHG